MQKIYQRHNSVFNFFQTFPSLYQLSEKNMLKTLLEKEDNAGNQHFILFQPLEKPCANKG